MDNTDKQAMETWGINVIGCDLSGFITTLSNQLFISLALLFSMTEYYC